MQGGAGNCEPPPPSPGPILSVSSGDLGGERGSILPLTLSPPVGPEALPGEHGPCPLWQAAQVLKEAEEEGSTADQELTAVNNWLSLLGRSRWHKDGELGLELG